MCSVKLRYDDDDDDLIVIARRFSGTWCTLVVGNINYSFICLNSLTACEQHMCGGEGRLGPKRTLKPSCSSF